MKYNRMTADMIYNDFIESKKDISQLKIKEIQYNEDRNCSNRRSVTA